MYEHLANNYPYSICLVKAVKYVHVGTFYKSSELAFSHISLLKFGDQLHFQKKLSIKTFIYLFNKYLFIIHEHPLRIKYCSSPLGYKVFIFLIYYVMDIQSNFFVKND